MRVGCVGYAVRQGLGYLMKSFVDAGVVTDPIIWPHRCRENLPQWYSGGNLVVPETGSVTKLLERRGKFIDVLIAFETFFDWTVLAKCRELGIKTVLIPMYEWTPKVPYDFPDAVVCPSLLDQDYFTGLLPAGEKMGYGAGSWVSRYKDGRLKVDYLPIPVDPTQWRQRTTALRFLHNAGNVGHRWHKGTLELLKALPLVQNPDFRITIRGQDKAELNKVLKEAGSASIDPRLTIELGEIPYENLWDGFDVYVAPEKFNGLSLPLQEARAAGLLVMTSSRYPHSQWLPHNPLIPVKDYVRSGVGSSYFDLDEAVIDPQDIATRIDQWYGKDISNYSLTGRLWAQENSWERLKPRWLKTLESLL